MVSFDWPASGTFRGCPGHRAPSGRILVVPPPPTLPRKGVGSNPECVMTVGDESRSATSREGPAWLRSTSHQIGPARRRAGGTQVAVEPDFADAGSRSAHGQSIGSVRQAAGRRTVIANLVGGQWTQAGTEDHLDIYTPATGEVIGRVPLSMKADVDAAVRAAEAAFERWSRTPVMERVRLMFRFKALLEEHFEDLATVVTRHHGKTLEEARGEVRRG